MRGRSLTDSGSYITDYNFALQIGICVSRWLVKRHREEEALQVLVRIYGDEKRAGEQLLEIKSTLSETEESLSQTLKYICTWKNIQR